MLKLYKKIHNLQENSGHKRMSDGIIGQVDKLETLVQGLVASHKPEEGKSTQLISLSSVAEI